MHVAIVGAGIVGIATAHAMLDAGHRVTLVDPGHQPGRPCDGNAGWIAHTDIMPLASPKVWRHLPGWLMDPLGPLAIRPSYIPSIAPWLLRFVAAARPAQIERSIRAIQALNAEALPAWRRRLSALGLTHHLRESGTLSVFSTQAAFRAADAIVSRQRAFGTPVESLDRRKLQALEPALGDRAVAGFFYPSGCHVSDPRAVVSDLGLLARERGVDWKQGRASAVVPAEHSVAVRLEGGATVTADRAVVAAGAWSKSLAAALGDAIPLDTERGYNLTLPPGSLGLSRPVAFEGEGFVTTPLDVGDRIGGAVEFAGLEAAPNYRRVDAIVGRLRRFLPDLPDPTPDGPRWMGFRPSIPDSLPVIGPARHSDRVVYAFGHAHHGLTQAAATAELVSALIDGRPSRTDAAPYAATRF